MSDRQSAGWERIYGRKGFWKRCVLSLEWKRVGVMDGEVVMMEPVVSGMRRVGRRMVRMRS